MENYTKGPWMVRENPHYFEVRADALDCYCINSGIYQSDSLKEANDLLPTKKEAEANFNLMAAAPELLEALQSITKTEQFIELPYELQNEITYCINKATGTEL